MSIAQNLITNFNNLSINRGIGAGGSNTNKFGKSFEHKTNNELKMRYIGYSRNEIDNKSKCKYNYMFSKTITEKDTKITYLCQTGLKIYMKKIYDISIFRYPDEAYIIESQSGDKILKILEKKEQKCDGSVETKLWSGPSLKREYEIMIGHIFKIEYGFCVNEFLKNKLNSDIKKYKVLVQILQENNIDLLFGDDKEYFNNLKKWIFK